MNNGDCQIIDTTKLSILIRHKGTIGDRIDEVLEAFSDSIDDRRIFVVGDDGNILEVKTEGGWFVSFEDVSDRRLRSLQRKLDRIERQTLKDNWPILREGDAVEIDGHIHNFTLKRTGMAPISFTGKLCSESVMQQVRNAMQGFVIRLYEAKSTDGSNMYIGQILYRTEASHEHDADYAYHAESIETVSRWFGNYDPLNDFIGPPVGSEQDLLKRMFVSAFRSLVSELFESTPIPIGE